MDLTRLRRHRPRIAWARRWIAAACKRLRARPSEGEPARDEMGSIPTVRKFYFRLIGEHRVVPDAITHATAGREVLPFCGSQLLTIRVRGTAGAPVEAHRGDQPLLLLNGREPDRQSQIGYRLQKEDLRKKCHHTAARCASMEVPPLTVSSNAWRPADGRSRFSILDSRAATSRSPDRSRFGSSIILIIRVPRRNGTGRL